MAVDRTDRWRVGRPAHRRLLLVLTFVCVVSGAGSLTAVGAATLQSGSCSLTETTIQTGETTTLVVEGAPAGSNYRYDREGDEQFDTDVLSVSNDSFEYQSSGSYQPLAEIRGPEGATTVVSCGELTVQAPPDAFVFANPDSANTGESVTLDGIESYDPDGQIVTYRFDVDDDGNFEYETTQSSVAHSYDTGGTYTVTLEAVDDDGYSGTDTTNVTINGDPTATFTTAPSSPTVGTTVTFDPSDSFDEDGEVVTYRWDFGDDGSVDATTETPTNQTRTYNTTGSKAVNLTVSDDDGASDTTVQVVDVVEANSPPAVEFSYSPDPPTAGQQVTFDATYTVDTDGTVETYRFDVDGDGDYEYENGDGVAEHTYQSGGDRTVTVNATDDDGATDSGERVVSVIDGPTADFVYDPTSPSATERVTFDPSTASTSEGTLVEYEWDLDGDGVVEDRTETARNVSFAYDSAGTYDVTLRVLDDDGVTDDRTRSVVVGEATSPPTAAFTLDPRPPRVGRQITFDASQSSDPDGDITSYDWQTRSWTASGATTTETFGSPGVYEVTLTVTDADGNTDRVTETVDVLPERREPVARCSVRPASPSAGASVALDASESERADAFEWDTNGDGTFDTDRYATPTYETAYDAGAYEPRVRVINTTFETTAVADCGNLTVEENQPPSPVVTGVGNATTGASVVLNGTDSFDVDGRIVNYSWQGQGWRATGDTVQHRFDRPGEYDVTLRVIDDDGAVARTTSAIAVRPSVFCSVARDGSDADSPISVDEAGTPIVLTVDTVENAYVEYDIDGDGEYERASETNRSTTVRYDERGDYTPQVRVTAGGVSATDTCGEISVAIPPGPTVPAVPWDLIGGAIAILSLGGLGLGLRRLLKRWRSKRPRHPEPDRSPGILDYQTDTFLTPTSSGTVRIDGVGFEPSLLVFTAATNVGTGGDGRGAPTRTAGWMHGSARRVRDGTVTQQVTAVADDSERTDAAMESAKSDSAIDVLLHTDDLPGGVVGRVVDTHDDGFTVDFEVAGLPNDEQFLVNYQAFRTRSDTTTAVGHFLTPIAPGRQELDLGIDADHVTLQAATAATGPASSHMTDVAVGFSQGDAVVGEETIDQIARTSSLEPSEAKYNSVGAFSDRALHLLYQSGESIAGRTSARVAALGRKLVMEYDQVYTGPSKATADRQTLVTYVATQSGDHPPPAVGHVDLDAVEIDDDGHLTVDVGFRPALIEVTASVADGVGADEPIPDTGLGFGWSMGTAIDDGDGLRQYLLHDSVNGPTATDGGDDRRPATDGPVAAGFLLDDHGRIVGREEVRVAATTDTGVELDVSRVVTAMEVDDAPSRPVLFYRAWPALE